MNQSDTLPKKYRVPPNKELEQLKSIRNKVITGLIVTFFLFELLLISEGEAGRTEEGAFVGLTFFCFGPSFAIFITMAFMMEREKINSLEERQKQKEKSMLGRIKGKHKSAKKFESDGKYYEAIEIWKDLGAYSQVKRVNDEQRKHEIKKAEHSEKLFHEEKGKDDTEPDKHLDEAIEIWKKLEDESGIERVNELKMNYLYEELKKKIDKLKNKGMDCTLLEKELSMLEKSLNKTPE
ncbi:MAG TPA: hypothetical protein QGI59_02760 [Candidatus Poseidoniia archaeon]|jgi:hypothetical protein|nr:hypothetical protein [Candidatus Poseidoniia archaeon]